MKVRLTILTENNVERKPEHTPELIKDTWQTILDLYAAFDQTNGDKATVEKVEILD